jgi:hypothetical protein
MKQSDLKHWKWYPERAHWKCGTVAVGNNGPELALHDVCENRSWSACALRELALIAEHLEQTGNLGPEPEEITAEEVREFMATLPRWYSHGTHGQLRLVNAGVIIAEFTVQQHCLSFVVLLLAAITHQTPEQFREAVLSRRGK